MKAIINIHVQSHPLHWLLIYLFWGNVSDHLSITVFTTNSQLTSELQKLLFVFSFPTWLKFKESTLLKDAHLSLKPLHSRSTEKSRLTRFVKQILVSLLWRNLQNNKLLLSLAAKICLFLLQFTIFMRGLL